MGFFKEVDLEIDEQAPDQATAQAWKQQASMHFNNPLETRFDNLPLVLQEIIHNTETIFVLACENINQQQHEESEV